MFKSFQDRETPLHIAVRTKNVEMVNLLLDHGASTDAIDKVRPQLISVTSLNVYFIVDHLKLRLSLTTKANKIKVFDTTMFSHKISIQSNRKFNLASYSYM